jgi:hypothetical protein
VLKGTQGTSRIFRVLFRELKVLKVFRCTQGTSRYFRVSKALKD